MPSTRLCKVCNLPAIDGCGNALDPPAGGTILRYIGEDTFSEDCPNMRVVALRQRFMKLDPQLLRVKHDASTPLYQTGEVDRTEHNLLLTQTNWLTFLSHFKWVLAHKGPRFFVRIVNDMTLKSVYMGEASVKARLPTQREGELPIFNGLEDLLASPDLVVIRVGFVVYFNRALASILMEALLLRDGLGKPTWIVESPGQDFKPWAQGDGVSIGMPCCNADVAGFVEARYWSLTLADTEPHPPAYEQHEDGVISARAASTEPEPLPQAEPDEASELEPEPEVERFVDDPSLDEDGEPVNDPELDNLTKRRPQKFKAKRRG